MRRSDFLPPVLTRLAIKALTRSGIRGNYQNWQAALSDSAPYQSDLSVYGQIADEVRQGRRKTMRLLSPLLSAMLLAGRHARVLDFGGNLGLQYFDVAPLVGECIDWWNVVELPEIVDYGNEHFANQTLHFHPTIEAAAAAGTPNIVLCFHVLQYLAAPFENISRLLALAPEVVVLHEFPVASRERFMVQRLLPELGGGSRPVRIFDRQQVAAAFAGYSLLEEIALPPWDPSLANAQQVARIYRRRTHGS